MRFSRRDVLLGSAAFAASRLAHAEPAAERPAIALVYLDGGYNAFFSAADCYVPKSLYGCNASNVRDVGNGIVVDASTMGTLPDAVLQKMATVGVAHGFSGHDFALKYAWFHNGKSVPLMLADALGGSAAFRCAHFGQAPARGAPHPAVNGVAMTSVPDLTAAIALATGASTGPQPDLMARSLRSSLQYGDVRFRHSPTALRKTWEGTHTLIDALERPPPPGIDWPELATAYGIAPTDMSAQSFTSQLAGAELMLRTGADVVCVTSHHVKVGGVNENWDTHGDGTGEVARQMMREGILPALKVFLERTLAMRGRNVVTLLYGDFARIGGNNATASEHAGGTSATVFGKYVRQGTTGRFDPGQNATYKLPSGTPNYTGLWSYLLAAANAPKRPFGANPHAALL